MDELKKMIVFSYGEGGDYHAFRHLTNEETVNKYYEAKQTGRLSFVAGDGVTEEFEPAYIALVNIVDGYDFIINEERI